MKKTAEYCDIELNEFQKSLTGDEDATYMKTITYCAEDFVPVMACPSQVDKIKNVSELEGTEIDQVFYRFLYKWPSGGSQSCSRGAKGQKGSRLR